MFSSPTAEKTAAADFDFDTRQVLKFLAITNGKLLKLRNSDSRAAAQPTKLAAFKSCALYLKSSRGIALV